MWKASNRYLSIVEFAPSGLHRCILHKAPEGYCICVLPEAPEIYVKTWFGDRNESTRLCYTVQFRGKFCTQLESFVNPGNHY